MLLSWGRYTRGQEDSSVSRAFARACDFDSQSPHKKQEQQCCNPSDSEMGGGGGQLPGAL